MGQKVAGTVYVNADGEQFQSLGGFEVPLFAFKRESVLPGYYKEEDMTPYVKGDVVFTREFPIDKLAKSENMTVTVEFKNGRAYILTEAYIVGETTYSADDGKVSLEFNGKEGVWQ